MHIRTREKPPSAGTHASAIGAEGGASLIELAIILPLAVLLISGMVELGYRINSLRIVANAARHGARVASAHSRRVTAPIVCGAVRTANCGGASVIINPTAASPVTLVAEQAACNFLRNTRNIDPAQWQVRSEVVTMSEPIGDPRPPFQVVTVALNQTSGCLICGTLLRPFIGEAGARFILEGDCA